MHAIIQAITESIFCIFANIISNYAIIIYFKQTHFILHKIIKPLPQIIVIVFEIIFTI